MLKTKLHFTTAPNKTPVSKVCILRRCRCTTRIISMYIYICYYPHSPSVDLVIRLDFLCMYVFISKLLKVQSHSGNLMWFSLQFLKEHCEKRAKSCIRKCQHDRPENQTRLTVAGDILSKKHIVAENWQWVSRHDRSYNLSLCVKHFFTKFVL